MRDVPYKIIKITALNLIILTQLLLNGCATPPEAEFIPPVFPPPPSEPRFIYERTIRSSGDVVELTAAQRFKVFATGSREAVLGIAKPFGVAVKEGRVYVSDTMQRAVLMFDVPRGEFKMIGTEGDQGLLSKPLGLSVAPNGDLYVADITQRLIMVYNKSGDFLESFGGPSLFDRPTGIALSPDGSKVYVIDTGGVGSKRHHMHIFDTATKEHIKTVGKRGTDLGDFNLPLQITTAADGTVYVVDGGNFRVEAFTPDGEVISSFGSAGNKSGNFSRPKGIATDSEGNVYVSDAAFGNFQIFDSEGKLLLFVGTRNERGGAAEFVLPSDIAVDEDGRVYMADQFIRKIDVFRPANLTVEDGYLGLRYKEQIQEQMEAERNKQ